MPENQSQVSSEPEALTLPEPGDQPESHSRWLKLARNPNFVGAMRWMLVGCFACGPAAAILFILLESGRSFEKTRPGITPFIFQKFIPPDISLPALLVPPLLLLIIGSFTLIGYLKGAAPPKIKSHRDFRSPGEKLAEFAVLYLIAFLVIFNRFCEDHPNRTSVEIISHPVFMIISLLIMAVVAYFVFSRHQSVPLQLFTMYSVIAVVFTLFIIGMIFYALISLFLYAFFN